MALNDKAIKIIVFDLDETLGSFSQLGALWDSLRDIYGKELSKQHFFKIVDLFPRFLRPNILDILQSLVHARKKGQCFSIILYTNNQGPKKWARLMSLVDFENVYPEVSADISYIYHLFMQDVAIALENAIT